MMCAVASGPSMGLGEVPTNDDIIGSLLFSETNSPEVFDIASSALSTPEVLDGQNVFGLYDEILCQLSASPMASSESDISALAHPSYMHNQHPGAMMPPHSMHGSSYHSGYSSYGPPPPMSVCTVPGCYACPPPIPQGPCYSGCGCGMDSYSMQSAPRISRTYSVGDVDMYCKERMHRRNSLPVGHLYRPMPYSRTTRGPYTLGQTNTSGSSATSFEGLSTPSASMGSPPIAPLGVPTSNTQKKNTHYMCGNCFSVGHNRRTCPNAKQTKERRDSKSQVDSCSQSPSP